MDLELGEELELLLGEEEEVQETQVGAGRVNMDQFQEDVREGVRGVEGLLGVLVD